MRASVCGVPYKPEFEIDDPAGATLLEQALLQLDRANQARALIEANGGPVVEGRFGQLRTHPMLGVERDAFKNFLAGMRDLHFLRISLDIGNQILL